MAKPVLLAHEVGVGLADRLADQRREPREIHALARPRT